MNRGVVREERRGGGGGKEQGEKIAGGMGALPKSNTCCLFPMRRPPPTPSLFPLPFTWCTLTLAFAALFVVALVLRRVPFGDDAGPKVGPPQTSIAAAVESMQRPVHAGDPSSLSSQLLFHPITTPTGVRFFLARPPAKPIVGLVALFHGCSHDASIWWSGPEERQVVGELLSAGFALAAWSSNAQDSHACWEPFLHEKNLDLSRALELLRPGGAIATAVEQVSALPPLVLLGASSGGGFASMLAAALPKGAVGLVSYIAPLHDSLMSTLQQQEQQRGDVQLSSNSRLNTIILVHMPRDDFSASKIEEQLESLKSAAAAASGRSVLKEFRVLPRALCQGTLHRALPSRITARASAALFGAINASGALRDVFDRHTRYPDEVCASLRMNSRSSVVVDALRLAFDGNLFPPRVIERAVPLAAAVDVATLKSLCERATFPVNSPASLTGGYLCAASDVLFDEAGGRGTQGRHPDDVTDLAALRKVVFEVLNDLFAEHEMTAEWAPEVASLLKEAVRSALL